MNLNAPPRRCPICTMPPGVPQDRAYLMGYALARRTNDVGHRIVIAQLCADHRGFIMAMIEGKSVAKCPIGT